MLKQIGTTNVFAGRNEGNGILGMVCHTRSSLMHFIIFIRTQGDVPDNFTSVVDEAVQGYPFSSLLTQAGVKGWDGFIAVAWFHSIPCWALQGTCGTRHVLSL
jgi:hypothetical protein